MTSSANAKRQEIEKLIIKIPEQDAKELLIDFLLRNEGLKNELQLKYDFQMNAIQMTNLKRRLRILFTGMAVAVLLTGNTHMILQ